MSGGKLSDRTAKLSTTSGLRNNMLVYPADYSSKRSSASYETERSLAEIESGSITFHHPPSMLSGADTSMIGGGGSGMKNAPSLHETHFSIDESDSPLTILHPPGR